MIDALYKTTLDGLWDRLGRRLARTGLTPNAVTMIGLVASSLNSALFLWHRRLLLYGVLLALIEFLDNVDGALARVTGRKTRLGSFLDAATDRYKETFSLIAVAVVTGHWLAASLALSASLLVSYHHARAAMEGARADGGWPDLFERMERVATLCAGLILAPLVPARLFGADLLHLSLWALAFFAHLTALQRMVRACRVLRE